MLDIIVLFFIAGGILLFLLLREFWSWYFKINKIIDNQQQTNLLLNKMLNFQTTGKLGEEAKESSFNDIEGELIIQNILTEKIQGISRIEYDRMMKKMINWRSYRILEERDKPQRTT